MIPSHTWIPSTQITTGQYALSAPSSVGGAVNLAASREDLIHVTQAEREAEVQPDGMADDLGREAVAGITGANERRHPVRLPALLPIRKPANSQVDDAD